MEIKNANFLCRMLFVSVFDHRYIINRLIIEIDAILHSLYKKPPLKSLNLS